MSLILDALKRAERERRAGQAPTPLESIAVPSTEIEGRSAHRWLLPALIGAVVAGGGVYAFLLLRSPSSTPAPAAVAAAPVPAMATPAALVASSPPAAETPSPAQATVQADDAAVPSARASIDDSRIATLDDLVDGKRPAPRDTPRPVPNGSSAEAGRDGRPDASPNASGVRPSAAGTEQLPPFEQPVGPPPLEAAPSPPAERPAALPPSISPTSGQPTAATPASAESAAASARNFKEMSPNYRSEFPALTVDIHVYNDEPQRRFVMLNGKRYHEGDTIAEGPRIIGIVADGIVFDWRGERVVYGLSR